MIKIKKIDQFQLKVDTLTSKNDKSLANNKNKEEDKNIELLEIYLLVCKECFHMYTDTYIIVQISIFKYV